jgi:hypothetical protein
MSSNTQVYKPSIFEVVKATKISDSSETLYLAVVDVNTQREIDEFNELCSGIGVEKKESNSSNTYDYGLDFDAIYNECIERQNSTDEFFIEAISGTTRQITINKYKEYQLEINELGAWVNAVGLSASERANYNIIDAIRYEGLTHDYVSNFKSSEWVFEPTNDEVFDPMECIINIKEQLENAKLANLLGEDYYREDHVLDVFLFIIANRCKDNKDSLNIQNNNDICNTHIKHILQCEECMARLDAIILDKRIRRTPEYKKEYDREYERLEKYYIMLLNSGVSWKDIVN